MQIPPAQPEYTLEYRGYKIWFYPDGHHEAWRSTGVDTVQRVEGDRRSGMKQVKGTEVGVKRVILSVAGENLLDEEVLQRLDNKLTIKRAPQELPPPELGLLFDDDANVPSQKKGWSPDGE